MKNHQGIRIGAATLFLFSVLLIRAGYSLAGDDFSVISASGASWQTPSNPGYSVVAPPSRPSFQPVSSSSSAGKGVSGNSTTATKKADTTAEAVSEKPEDYKNATTYAESGNADIKSVAENLTKNCTTDKAKAQAIFDYVSQNYAYKYYYRTAAGAEEMLGKKEGNGADQSHLFVALCRAAGLSARYQHAMTGNAAGMGDGVPNEVDRIYAQVYVDGKWQNADPADKRNKNVGDLTVTIKGDIKTYNEYKNKNETNVTLSAKTTLTSAEVTAYNRFQKVEIDKDNGLYWNEWGRGKLPSDAIVPAVEVHDPLSLDEVKDYIKYQNVEKIGDQHYWLASQKEEVSKEPLTAEEVSKYQQYQQYKLDAEGVLHKPGGNVDPGQIPVCLNSLPLEEQKEYIKYSAVVKEGDKYYWSADAVPSAKHEAQTDTKTTDTKAAGTKAADTKAADTKTTDTTAKNEPAAYGADMQKYLKRNASSAVQAKADQLTAGKTTDYDKAKAVYDWVNKNKRYALYYNTSKGAAGMLTAGSGNCCDQAHLIVALARDAGLPARYKHNTACTFKDGTYGHVWAQIYVGGKWVDADAVSAFDSFGKVAFTANHANDRIYDTLPF